MVSIDTNILIRIFTNDEPGQTHKALDIFKKNLVFVSKTVLLETEWVLRYSYKLDTKVITESFRKLIGLDNIEIENLPQVLATLELYEKGMDFADALHLNACKDRVFATFDKKMAAKSKKLGKDNVLLLK